jgi:hypothetical protein
MSYYLDKEGRMISYKDIEHTQFQKEKTHDEMDEYIKKTYELVPEEYCFHAHKYFCILAPDDLKTIINNRIMKKLLFNILRIERNIK